MKIKIRFSCILYLENFNKLQIFSFCCSKGFLTSRSLHVVKKSVKLGFQNWIIFSFCAICCKLKIE